jgi:hypothetical protein
MEIGKGKLGQTGVVKARLRVYGGWIVHGVERKKITQRSGGRRVALREALGEEISPQRAQRSQSGNGDGAKW